MSSHFQPKDSVSGKTEVEKLAEVFGTTIGTERSYEELSAVLGRDIREARGPIYQLQRHLELYHNRTIENVPRRGYRIAEPLHHEHLGLRQHARSRRALASAHRKFMSADRSEMPADVVARFDALTRQVAEMQMKINRFDRKLQEHEQAFKTVVTKEEHKAALAITEKKMKSFVEEALQKAGLDKKVS